MVIIYHCYGGSHSSVTAASLHLGLLSADKLPTVEELSNLPNYDKQVNKDHGTLKLMGKDRYNNPVYIIGRRSTSKQLENLFYGLMEIFDLEDNKLLMINCMPYVNWRMVVGGYISRRLGIIKLGRPIVSLGTIYAYYDFVNLVESVKMISKSKSKR